MEKKIKLLDTEEVFEVESEDSSYYYYIDIEPEINYVSHEMASDGHCPEREGEQIVNWKQIMKRIEKDKCKLILSNK